MLAQDSCVVTGPDHVRIYFTLTNQSANGQHWLCAFSVDPDPSPATPECAIAGCDGDAFWVCSPNIDGGVWFGVPPFEYPWACLDPYQSLGGFYITIDPDGGCCYDLEFANDYYQDWWVMSWCPDPCGTTPTARTSWSTVKDRY